VGRGRDSSLTCERTSGSWLRSAPRRPPVPAQTAAWPETRPCESCPPSSRSRFASLSGSAEERGPQRALALSGSEVIVGVVGVVVAGPLGVCEKRSKRVAGGGGW